MPTLTVLPESSFTLTVTGDTAGEGSVTLEPTPQAAMTLHVNPLGPDIDLTPLLGALESISAALPVDLSPVLDAVGPLATAADLANLEGTVVQAIAAIPAPAQPDFAPVLNAIAAIPTTDVATAVAPLATAKNLAAVAGAVLQALAALPPAIIPGQVIDVSLDENGQPPAGYELVNGIPSLPYVPMGGLLAYFGRGTGAPNNVSGKPLQTQNGDVFQPHISSFYRWSPDTGYSSAFPNLPDVNASNINLAPLPTGRILEAGSSTNSTAKGRCWAFNFASNTWNAVAPFPVSRFACALSTMSDGRVVAIGGCSAFSATAATITDRVDVFDEPSNTWSPAAPAPVRGYGPSALVSDGTVLWLPRAISDGTSISTTNSRGFIYRPLSDDWFETDPLPASVVVTTATALVRDDAGALFLGINGGRALRYTAGNAPGFRWSVLEVNAPSPTAQTYHGGCATKLRDGTIFMPMSSDYPVLISVQYNPGNQVVKARKR